MKRSLVLLVYLCAGFALYFGTFNNPFLLDDHAQIVQNNDVHDLSSIFQSFSQSTMASDNGIGGIYYKPMMMIAYNLLWNVGGGNPIPFHVFQLLLHGLNGFLAFILFQKVFGRDYFWSSFLAGLVFTIHPVNSEAVLMIADLQEPLFTVFGLGALLALSSMKSAKTYVLVGFLFLCSLLSKESGLFYILIATAYVFLMKKQNLKGTLATAITVMVVYLGLRLGLANLHAASSDNMQIMRADLATRLMTVPKVLFHQLFLYFSPQDLSLTQDWVIQEPTLNDFWLPLFVVLWVFAMLAVYFYRTKNRVFGFFFAWVLLGLLAHSQILPLDGTVSDRWLYFPIVGLLGLTIYFFTSIVDLRRNYGMPFAVVAIALLSARTYARTFDWKDEFTLYKHDVKMSPDSFYLNNNLGLEYLNRQKANEAIPYFEKTISTSPKGSRAWLVGWRNLGATYLETGNFAKAEECFRIALAENDVKSYRGLAWSLLQQGKEKELAAFLENDALKKFSTDTFLLQLKNIDKGK